jgi:hypothetical protein
VGPARIIDANTASTNAPPDYRHDDTAIGNS